MTLAMAETLVGKDFRVRPDEILRGKLDDIDDETLTFFLYLNDVEKGKLLALDVCF